MAPITQPLSIALFVAVLVTGCQSSPAGSGGAAFFPTDRSRNVLSFATALEPILPSVVLVGNLQPDETGKPALAGLGSGAVIDAEKGYIITNAHVVKDGAAYVINVPDGRVLEARLVGMDTPTDIAVLQADDLRVAAVTLADSDRLRVGDIVFAVGYPLGLEQSLSLGVISGLGRSRSTEGLQNFIQTDAAINSGNSGGPLLDSKGRLIGINTSILSHSGGSEGVAFSVPTSLAAQVAKQLITHGEVRRGSIGITMAPVTEEAAAQVGVDSLFGALIDSVRSDSEAARAKLQPGDLIIGFAGRQVKSPHALRAWIGVANPGEAYKLTYIRENGVENTIDIVARAFKRPLIENLEQLGAYIRPVSPEKALLTGAKGVYVYDIVPSSPAERAGLRVGDIIAAVNNELATDEQVCDHLVSEAQGRARLVVYRFGVAMPIIIEP